MQHFLDVKQTQTQHHPHHCSQGGQGGHRCESVQFHFPVREKQVSDEGNEREKYESVCRNYGSCCSGCCFSLEQCAEGKSLSNF